MNIPRRSISLLSLSLLNQNKKIKPIRKFRPLMGGGFLNGERKSDAGEQRSEIDSVCFSFRIVKIWIYSHLTADFPLMDGYSEAVADLFIICL